MARHSKLLDKDAAQQVLIQKHFADTSAGGGMLASLNTSRRQSGRPQSVHHSETPTSELNLSHSHAPLPLRADLQRRLDSVLNDLLMPPKSKLDLVLRYTQADQYDKFPTAVQLWERVQAAVSWRERVMKSLWDFEMLASDPRRHFRSISTHRLREEKERDGLFSKLNQASNACLESMDELFRCCGDTVCLGDRPYRDKMKKDYTELLYDVEQERLRIIYDGVRPHVAPAVDEYDDDNGAAREENETLHTRPSSGHTLINVRVPSAVAIPRNLAPRRPLNRKDGSSPNVVASSAIYKLEEEKSGLPGSVHDNQNQEHNDIDAHSLEVDGDNGDPTNTRYRLATPRESIFVPVSSLDNKPKLTGIVEPEQHIRRASRVTVQVQQQRQAELAALSKQAEEKQNESVIELMPSSQRDAFPMAIVESGRGHQTARESEGAKPALDDPAAFPQALSCARTLLLDVQTNPKSAYSTRLAPEFCHIANADPSNSKPGFCAGPFPQQFAVATTNTDSISVSPAIMPIASQHASSLPQNDELAAPTARQKPRRSMRALIVPSSHPAAVSAEPPLDGGDLPPRRASVQAGPLAAGSRPDRCDAFESRSRDERPRARSRSAASALVLPAPTDARPAGGSGGSAPTHRLTA
ncbi:hypothetical protein ON010_g16552 [Phytophthora cinnamomi]|nr:hypothetical protein ON010_g16552 [Phytophthora cinnamomi]